MKMLRTLTFMLVAVVGCSSEPTEPQSEGTVRLLRQPARRVAIELSNLSRPVAAMQLSLSVTGGEATAQFDDLLPVAGVRLDSVRLKTVGAGRAIAFVGDTRGVPLPGVGSVASFVVQGGSGGTLSLSDLVLSDENGKALNVSSGPDIILP